MPISIERSSKVPVYLQIKNQLLYDVAIGRLAPHSRLPSIRRLAQELHLTTATVRHAYGALAEEGVVEARQGFGMVVAEFTRYAEPVSARRQYLSELLVPALSQAQAAGYGRDEILAVARQWAASAHRRVVVVSPDEVLLDRYLPMVRSALDGLDVEVAGALLPAVRRAPRPLDMLGNSCCVATFIRNYVELRRLLEGSDTPLVGLALDLAADTQAELLLLPHTLRGVLVASEVSVPGMAHLVERYWAPEVPLEVVGFESPRLAAAVQSADVVIHSPRARRAVQSLPIGRKRVMELNFILNEVSVSELRRVVAEAAGAEASEASATPKREALV